MAYFVDNATYGDKRGKNGRVFCYVIDWANDSEIYDGAKVKKTW